MQSVSLLWFCLLPSHIIVCLLLIMFKVNDIPSLFIICSKFHSEKHSAVKMSIFLLKWICRYLHVASVSNLRCSVCERICPHPPSPVHLNKVIIHKMHIRGLFYVELRRCHIQYLRMWRVLLITADATGGILTGEHRRRWMHSNGWNGSLLSERGFVEDPIANSTLKQYSHHNRYLQ